MLPKWKEAAQLGGLLTFSFSLFYSFLFLCPHQYWRHPPSPAIYHGHLL